MKARAAAVVAAAALVAGCAAHHPPALGVAEAARQAETFAATLRVSVKGAGLRGRAQVLAGFRRPDALRVEVPGPTGPRMVLVATGERLTAVFPGEAAVFEGAADAASLDAVLGVALTPREVMDMLVGAGSPRLTSYTVDWGPSLPRRVDAVLPDGARLSVRLDDAELGPPLGAAAFQPPPHDGYRVLDAAGARALWGGR